MVDLSRDANGQVRARLLDLVLAGTGRPTAAGSPPSRLSSGPGSPTPHSTRSVATPTRCATTERRGAGPERLPRRQARDEVRRRVQQHQLGRCGHKHDPLYKIRGLLRNGLEHLTERQHTRPQAGLLAGDSDSDVELAWTCYQRLRAIYARHSQPARAQEARRKAARGSSASAVPTGTGTESPTPSREACGCSSSTTSYTTGARANSAAGALREVGAHVADLLVLVRRVNSDSYPQASNSGRG